MRISDWSSDVCSSDLAFQNKMVADLAEGAGIKALTIASFVLANERFIEEQGTDRHKAAHGSFAGSMLVVDETSMVSSSDMLKLHGIAEALGVDKLVLVGEIGRAAGRERVCRSV